jgi:hypothetical protein
MSTQKTRTSPTTLVTAATAVAIGLGWLSGCITGQSNPAATQPAAALDVATSQPTYWLNQPVVAEVPGKNFDTLWESAKDTVRAYLFTLDRQDYRSGVITTAPEISKQFFEFWRHDAGTPYDAFSNTMGAIRRTIRFEVARNADNTFTLVPKVLVERQSIFERRVTDVSQYRFAFAGPLRVQPARTVVTLDPETYQDVPVKYWYAIGRDGEMEKQLAERVRKTQQKREAAASAAASAASTTR